MIGKQVRFYMRPGDEAAFVRYVCEHQSGVLLAALSLRRKTKAVATPLKPAARDKSLTRVMIGISSFPIMNDSLHKHVMRKYDPKFGDYRVTGEIRYSLDVGSVPVIEFDRSFINAYGLLTHGRLWASMYNFENGAQRRRNQAFVSWYDPIANWVRRHGRRVKGIDGYVHPEAVEWFTSGGKLQM